MVEGPSRGAPRRVHRHSIALLTALILLLTVGYLTAHDDDKLEEMGEPIPGSGHVGEILLPDASGRILDFAAENVALLSWLTPEDITGFAQNANDIWGYVSPSGREYAIVGLNRGTAFVEVTDPLNPVVVKVIQGAFSAWRDMATYREFAYSVNETGDGIQVIDLRRIDRGRVKLRSTVTERGLWTAHNITINEESGYAYLSGSNLAGGGLVAVDLSDPLQPRVERATWPLAYIHDIHAVTFDEGPRAGREIVFAFAGRSGLKILDVTDKSNIFEASEVRYPGLAYGHSGWLNRRQKFLYVNDELDERESLEGIGSTTYIVDVRDLENPRFVRAYRNGSPAIDHNSMVRRKLLFQANYTSGLRIFKVKKARFPREVAYFDTYPDSDDPIFSGAWGVYSGLPSGVILVSDIQRGLFVLI